CLWAQAWACCQRPPFFVRHGWNEWGPSYPRLRANTQTNSWETRALAWSLLCHAEVFSPPTWEKTRNTLGFLNAPPLFVLHEAWFVLHTTLLPLSHSPVLRVLSYAFHAVALLVEMYLRFERVRVSSLPTPCVFAHFF